MSTGTSQYSNNVDSTTSGTAGSEGMSHGGGVKGVAAAVHLAGEKIRGTFNNGVDSTAHEDTSIAKNDAVAQKGDSEIHSVKFSKNTKKMDGALPGRDYEMQQRHGEQGDLNRE